jgi:transmembrane sensor
MQTPQSGSGIAIDRWIGGDDSYCDAESGQSTDPPLLSRRRFLRIGATAAVVAAASGGGLWWHIGKGRYQTQIGQMGYVELPDGSMAILNTSSEIGVAFTHTTRRVTLLRGEAVFDIASDPSRLFITDAGNFRVETPGPAFSGTGKARIGWLVDYARDIATPLTQRTSHTLFATRGTTFTLRRKPLDRLELVVLEGFVEIRPRSPARLDLTRVGGDTAVETNRDATIKVSRIDQFELEARVAWLQRRLVFNSSGTLHDAASEFNRYNEVQIRFEGPIGLRQIRGAFDVDHPHDFVRLIETLPHVRATVTRNLIVLREQDGGATTSQ